MTAQERVASVLNSELPLLQCGTPLVDAFGKHAVTVDLEPFLMYHVTVDGTTVTVCEKKRMAQDPDDVIVGAMLVGIPCKEVT